MGRDLPAWDHVFQKSIAEKSIFQDVLPVSFLGLPEVTGISEDKVKRWAGDWRRIEEKEIRKE